MASGTFAPRNDVVSAAPIDFAQMIDGAGARPVVNAMSDRFQISGGRMREIIAHSGPFFFRAHQHWAERPGGIGELNKLVHSGGPQQFADRAELVYASISEQEGRVYLENLFLEDEVVDMVTRRIAARLDIDPQKVQRVMPNLAALFLGVLCKSMTP